MADKFVPRSVSHKPKMTALLPKIKKVNPQTAVSRLSEFTLTTSGSSKSEETASTSSVKPSDSLRNSLQKVEEQMKEDDSEDEVVYFSKKQRWPDAGEPVCVVCGRYGEYICDQTEVDVCSKECKAKNLQILRRTAETDKSKKAIELNVEKEKEEVEKTDIESVFQPYSYKLHPVVASLSDSQVSELRNRMDISVKGNRIERPVLEFFHCNLNPKLLENLKSCGYEIPTPVQMQVIPVALAGVDVLVCAQTGSGKTAAFLVPMITKVHHEMVESPQDHTLSSRPKGLVLAPTRELCMQIEKQAKELMAGLSHMKTALIIGGMPVPSQLYRLQQGVQIVCATPGRMAELMNKRDTDLSEIRFLVIDEVDLLTQMGFESQVQSILEALPSNRQTLLFSATIPPAVERMSSSLLNNPTWISVGVPSAPNMAVKQIVLWVDDKSKKKRLFSLLKDFNYFTPPILVFVDSKMGADLLAGAIHMTCDVRCTSMHGDKVQSERTRILEAFLAGEYDVLVCTGVLGRGLDLPSVRQVINFDMPSSVDEYIHQVGRAGRLDSRGLAITFINNTNKGVFLDLVETVQPHGVRLPEELTNSPHLDKLQYERRHKRTGRKRKNEECYVNRENIMDMLKKSTFRRRLKNR